MELRIEVFSFRNRKIGLCMHKCLRLYEESVIVFGGHIPLFRHVYMRLFVLERFVFLSFSFSPHPYMFTRFGLLAIRARSLPTFN